MLRVRRATGARVSTLPFVEWFSLILSTRIQESQ